MHELLRFNLMKIMIVGASENKRRYEYEKKIDYTSDIDVKVDYGQLLYNTELNAEVRDPVGYVCG